MSIKPTPTSLEAIFIKDRSIENALSFCQTVMNHLNASHFELWLLPFADSLCLTVTWHMTNHTFWKEVHVFVFWGFWNQQHNLNGSPDAVVHIIMISQLSGGRRSSAPPSYCTHLIMNVCVRACMYVCHEKEIKYSQPSVPILQRLGLVTILII